MVTHDCFIAGNPRQNSLAATAKPGHGMEGYSTGYDNLIGPNCFGIKPDIITVARRTDFQKIILIAAVMIDDGKATYHVFTADHFIFFRRMSPVSPLSRNDLDLLIRNTGQIQFIYNDRQHLCRMDRARDVTDDDGNRIPGRYDVGQGKAVNGLAQGLSDSGDLIGDGIYMIPM